MQDDDSIVNQVRGIQFFETGLVTGTEGDDLINLNRAEAGENGLTVSPGGGDNEIRLSNDDTDVDLILDENADNVIVARQNSEGEVDVDNFNNGDQIDLSRKGVEDINELVFTQDNGTLTVELGDEDDDFAITVQDVDVLSEDDFIFAEADDEEEEVAEDEEEAEEEVAEEVAEDEEEEEVAEDDDEDLNVIDISDQEGVAEAEGTADADLIIASADASNRINAGGGDDVIELAEGFDVDLISTGAGNDTIIANEGGIALANDFNENRDVLDFSGVDGADSFDDIEITRDDESDEDFLGLTEVKSGDSTRIFVSEEAGDALDEDNFVFVDDAVA